MNVERILQVADAIENHSIPDLGFNTSSYVCSAGSEFYPDYSGHSCGTTACIAGWAVAVDRAFTAEQLIEFDDFEDTTAETAQEIMGLSSTQASKLFYQYAKTPTEAAATLRRLAETGEVVWA